MLSECILFIIERISDILKVDKERNEILTLCKELSHDERKVFLEFYLDPSKREFLEVCSDDKLREYLELHSDDERKQIMRWYLSDPMEEIQKLYSVDEIQKFLELQAKKRETQQAREMGEYLAAKRKVKKLSSDDKMREIDEVYLYYCTERSKKLPFPVDQRGNGQFHNLYLPSDEYMKMYKELSDDDKEEFLHKYDDCWRKTLLKYLEFRQRYFQNLLAGTFFHILTSLIEGKEVVLSKDVEEGIHELQKWLSEIHKYIRNVEAKYNNTLILSKNELQLYLNLSYIADSSDDFLDRVMSNHVTTHDIHTLLAKIHNFCSNQSSIQLELKFVMKDNIKSGGPQSLANAKFSINRSMPSKDKQYSRPISYGHVPNPDIVGFNHEIQILLNHLIQPHYETRVLGIVGPGGSGKTTLAKHIYHHPQINTDFTHKVWVCVSQSWDKATILNLMWRQDAPNPNAATMECDEVVYELFKLLCSESYLVVVDDIWSVDAWYDISPALPAYSRSKVVVTTRNKSLPQHIDHSVLIVEPKQLNDEECYELFKKRAVLDENIHHELKSLGVEMLKKCKGLPLAVVALAGVLGIDKRLSSWERISKRVTDKMLNIENETTQGVVKKILALSYHELPEYLKPCALYLRVFPEDYMIEAQQVIEMWIAECFMDEEYEAKEYLEELAQRSIVEVVETDHKGQVLWFWIHGLIREMFIYIDKERGILKNQLRVALSTTLHDHGHNDFDSDMEILDRFLYGKSHTRSLIFFNFQDHHRLELEPLFIKLKSLRVLILEQIHWLKLPKEIGNLIHLRYLQLTGSSKLLPGSIGNLENLLTLNLGDLDIYEDRKTINLEKLKELRHLYMPQRRHLFKGMEKLKKLKTLWNGEGGEWMLSVMPKLSDVLQELCIQHIKEEKQVEEVFRTPSTTSNNLHTLVLHWDCEVGGTSMMSKCKSITKLVLNGKIKEGTPLMFPPNLIHLEMSYTEVEEKQVMNIISNSCPLLKFLFFGRCAYRGTELVCNENSFPQLVKLELKSLGSLKLWIIERGAMPKLNHLKISDCPLLEVNGEGWDVCQTFQN